MNKADAEKMQTVKEKLTAAMDSLDEVANVFMGETEEERERLKDLFRCQDWAVPLMKRSSAMAEIFI